MTNKASRQEMWGAARDYLNHGFSVIPCRKDKKPVRGWRDFTAQQPTPDMLETWFFDKGYQSIGLVGGSISGNVVFIDLDGIPAIKMFANSFPLLCETTKSVLTGSQQGIHLYVRVKELPNNINVRVPDVGGFEIRGNGQYVIAPPSPHPSGWHYRVHRSHPIKEMNHIHDIHAWMESLRDLQRENQSDVLKKAPRREITGVDASKRAFLSTVVSQEIRRVEIAHDGNRNNALFYAGLRISNYCAGGELDWNDMSSKLLNAAIGNGMPRIEAERTIASAWRIGSQRPKTVK